MLVKLEVPIYFQKQAPPLVSYKYTIIIISRSVFNYNDTLHNNNIDGYSDVSLCDCESSTFCYEPHGDVITGHLCII